jgi:hypothetical protein
VDASELDTAEERDLLEGTDEAEELDLGAGGNTAFEEAEHLLADADEPGVGDEDFGLGGPDDAHGLDAGEEGPEAADEDLREEDLPRLDADEDGEVGDEELIDPGFAERQEQPPMLWAEKRWELVGAPLTVGPTRAVVCAGKAVVAASEGLVRADLEGATEALAARGLEGEVRKLAIDSPIMAVATQGGALYVSRDAGASFEEPAGWRARVPDGSNAVAAEVLVDRNRVWVRTGTGALMLGRDAGASWEGPVADGVAALALDGTGGLVAVARRAGRGQLVRVDETGAATHTAIPFDPRPLVAARGVHVACVARGGRVAQSVGDGEWRTVEGLGAVTALVFLDEAGTLVAAVYNEAEDATTLVLIAPGGAVGGAWRAVADIGCGRGDAEGDARVTALARDDAHGVLWVAGGFGLLAFELPVTS